MKKVAKWLIGAIVVLMVMGVGVLYLMGTFRESVLIQLNAALLQDAPLTSPVLQGIIDSVASSGRPAGFWVEADAIYAARLDAIRSARRTVHFETYAMSPGRRADDFARALSERAANGVQVRVLVDAYGGSQMPESYWERLRAAKVEVALYRPFSWRSPLQYNARTHRKLLLIDGELALVGGAGVSDSWDGEGGAPWRELEFALRGTVVGHLEGMFLQNWLVEGKPIALAALRRAPAPSGAERPIVITNESPSLETSSIALLYQLNLASASQRAWIASPYFLPNQSLLDAMVQARRRGVDVKVVTMGPRNDKPYIRFASRELYEPLLAAGVEVYEYQPSMLHAKAMVVDADRITSGSSNFDPRTFLRNDELTLTLQDPALSRQFDEFFRETLSKSQRVTPEAWRERSAAQQAIGRLTLLLERQL